MVGELDPAAELHRPPLGQERPRNTRLDTSERYSSFLRKSRVERAPSGEAGGALRYWSAAIAGASTGAEDIVDDGVGLDALGLAFEVEDQAVPQARRATARRSSRATW